MALAWYVFNFSRNIFMLVSSYFLFIIQKAHLTALLGKKLIKYFHAFS